MELETDGDGETVGSGLTPEVAVVDRTGAEVMELRRELSDELTELAEELTELRDEETEERDEETELIEELTEELTEGLVMEERSVVREVGMGFAVVDAAAAEVVVAAAVGRAIVVVAAAEGVEEAAAGVPGTPPAGQQAGLSAGQAATGPLASVVTREVTVLQWRVSAGRAEVKKVPVASTTPTMVRKDIMMGVWSNSSSAFNE